MVQDPCRCAYCAAIANAGPGARHWELLTKAELALDHDVFRHVRVGALKLRQRWGVCRFSLRRFFS